jgi:hypothetical protein
LRLVTAALRRRGRRLRGREWFTFGHHAGTRLRDLRLAFLCDLRRQGGCAITGMGAAALAIEALGIRGLTPISAVPRLTVALLGTTLLALPLARLLLLPAP